MPKTAVISAFRCLAQLVLVCQFSLALSQNDPSSVFKQNVVSPAPDAANLGRYGEYPVDLSNGLVEISIPIYEVKSGKLTLPISISFHSGGVKAYDIASVVGLGWSLNAGGAVTRSINGLPDEANGGLLKNPIPDQFDPGQYFSCFIARLADPYNTVDGQSDSYYYNLNGSSGKFAFREVKATGGPLEIVTIPARPVKISVSPAFDSFSITDVDGTYYEFGAPESSQVMGNIGFISNSNTSWYLTKIRSANKADSVVFTYTEPNVVVTLTGGNSMTERDQPQYSLTSRVSHSKTGTTTTHHSIQLKEIVFSNGKVAFDYIQDRVDVVGGVRLSSISVYQLKPGASFLKVKEFDFFQSYFTATSEQKSQIAHLLNPDLNPDVFKKRLRLDSMKEVGFQGGTELQNPAYKFHYEQGEFPWYGTTAQDFTGLYNGANDNETLLFYDMGSNGNGYRIAREFGANRDVNPSKMKVGTLTRIDFPTGGHTEFKLEPNQVQTSWVKITPTYSSYGPYALSSFAGQYQTTIQVTPAMTGESDRVQAVFTVSNINTNADKQISTSVTVYDETSHSLANLLVAVFPGGTMPAQIGIPANTASFTRNETLELIAGHTYTFSIGDPLNFPNGTLNRVYASINWQASNGSTSTTVTGTVYTGGLRVKEVVSTDGNKGVLRKGYNYLDWYYNSNLFNGNIDEMADRFKIRSSNNVAPGTVGIRIYYNTYGENLTFQLGNANNLTVGWGKVEEVQMDTLGNPLGKTVYSFRHGVDEVPSYLPYFRSDNEWMRAQILSEAVFRSNYDGTFTKLQEKINKYSDESQGLIKSYLSVLKHDDYNPGGYNATIRQCLPYLAGNLYDWIDFPQYLYRSTLDSTTTIQYDQYGENPQVVQTAFAYENDRHMQVTRTTQTGSTGKTLITRYKYSEDYPIVSCDQEACYANYNSQILSLQAQRKTCEENYYNEYLGYVASNNSSAATTAFNNYLACKQTYQNDVASTALLALNQCLSNYSSCVEGFAASGTDAEKAVVAMQKENILNVALQTTSGFVEGDVEYVTGLQKTNYRQWEHGGVEPDIAFALVSSKPVLATDFQSNPAAYTREIGRFSAYDENHNILQVQKDKDAPISYIWDYNSEFPIAEVTNSKASQIAYTSFESDGSGNWSISGTSRISSDNRTGERCYSLASGNITKSDVDTSVPSIISFWTKNGSVSVTGATIITSGSTINGWTYKEYRTDAATSTGTVALSGDGLIDELRLYPMASEMKTYTYNPLIGISTSSDRNGIVTHYRYDAQGRLISISDDDGNLVKAFKYHFAAQD